MIGAIAWVVIFVLLIIIAGKIPKQDEAWLIIDAAACVFWLFVGALLVVRGIVRFVKH